MSACPTIADTRRRYCQTRDEFPSRSTRETTTFVGAELRVCKVFGLTSREGAVAIFNSGSVTLS